jgi:peptidyl-prolyl cis-trans isomerase A (cyclophilin A)
MRFAIRSLALLFLLPACDDSKKAVGEREATKTPAKTEAGREEKPEADAKEDAKEAAPEATEVVATGKDPIEGDFTLEQAFEGDAALADAAGGKLTATLTTSMGEFECGLFEKEAPITVANFVGLARGTRPWRDDKAGGWVKRPYYDGVIFHRVEKDFMAQTGDHTGAGNGGPGYNLAKDELGLKHKWAGTLSMANLGPGTANSQFFVTVKPTPHLNGKHAVFGKCDPSVAKKITEVKVDPRRNNRPYEPVKLERVTIARKQ